MRVLSIFFLCMLVLGVSTVGWAAETHEVWPIGGNITSIDLSGFNGTISFEPVASDEDSRVEVDKQVRGFASATMKRYLEKLVVEDQSRGEHLVLVVNQPRQPFGVLGSSVDFTVYAVPSKIAQFRAKTSNGSISLSFFEGEIDLQTSNGSITLDRFVGSGHGRTSNGSIVLNQVELTRGSDFRTSNGRIEGDVALARNFSYSFDTSNGRIEMRFPRDTEGMFDLSTSNGTSRLTLGSYRVEGKNVNTRIGEDNTVIRLKTSNGNITVEESYRF